jgi:uncharacterized membrane protein
LEGLKGTSEAVVDTMLVEFSALRDEIRQRINNQFLILAGSIALITALVPIVQHSSREARPTVFMVAGGVFGLIAALYFDQHLIVIQIARYTQEKLRPRLLEELQLPRTDDAILGWEQVRRQLDRLRLVFGLRVTATIGVGVICMISAVVLNVREGSWSGYAIAASVGDACIYLALGALVKSLVSHHYQLVAGRDSEHPRPAP